MDRLKILDIIYVANEVKKHYELDGNLELLKISSIYDLYNNMPFFTDDDFKPDNFGQLRVKVLKHYDVPRQYAMRFNMRTIIKMCAQFKRDKIKVVPQVGLDLTYAVFTEMRTYLIENLPESFRINTNMFLEDFVRLYDKNITKQARQSVGSLPTPPGPASVAPLSPMHHTQPRISVSPIRSPLSPLSPGKKGEHGIHFGGKKSRRKRTNKKHKSKKHV